MSNSGNRLFPLSRPQLLACLRLLAQLAVCFAVLRLSLIYLGFLFPTVSFLILYLCRPGSPVHAISIQDPSWLKRAAACLIILLTVLLCVLPMGQCPTWNGEIPGHRNQYELMAENLLEGRLHFAYGDEDQILSLHNPYDPEERKTSGVAYHWDHAFYNGRYYMYFGIVPVLLVFLPYRVLTGMPLTTYHGTQIFTVFIILGIFALFQLMARRFFRHLPASVCLALASACSVMSVWYAAAEPALYCTAITAAIALQIWSLYFFIRAVWVETKLTRQLWLAALGALLGALVFGCRPPIAFANLLVLPMLAVFLRQRPLNRALAAKLFLAALPYVVVAVALMLYNQARFDDPFEFGQKYQLTSIDQSRYGFYLDTERKLRLINDTQLFFLKNNSVTEEFPYLKTGGVFMNFPMLLLSACILSPAVRKEMKQLQISGLAAGFVVSIVLIAAMDILWAPWLLDRYRMDVYFLLGIFCFLCLGIWHRVSSPGWQSRLNALLVACSLLTVLWAILLCLRTSMTHSQDLLELFSRIFLYRPLR